MAIPSSRRRRLTLSAPLNLRNTLDLQRCGPLDPTVRLRRQWLQWGVRTPEGPTTVALELQDKEVLAEAWGAGADWILAFLPAWLTAAAAPALSHAGLRRIAREYPGTHLSITPDPFNLLVIIILQQRVEFEEASRSYRRLIMQLGEPAPGPFELRVPPEPARWRTLSLDEMRRAGVDHKRGGTIHEAATRARHLARLIGMSPLHGERVLSALRGVGPWTAHMVGGAGLGWSDAAPVGDVWLPSMVSWGLAGERWADDARMLELLEPYRPHRWWVIRLLQAAGVVPPGQRRGRGRPLAR